MKIFAHEYGRVFLIIESRHVILRDINHRLVLGDDCACVTVKASAQDILAVDLGSLLESTPHTGRLLTVNHIGFSHDLLALLLPNIGLRMLLLLRPAQALDKTVRSLRVLREIVVDEVNGIYLRALLLTRRLLVRRIALASLHYIVTLAHLTCIDSMQK